MTDKQLQPLLNLKKFDIIYYPESKPHKIQEHFDWKVKEIKEIIEKSPRGNFVFKIFDDMSDYFPKLRKFAGKQNIQLYLKIIETETSWSQFIQ